MTDSHSTATKRILVAIDVAKAKHDVLVELPDGARKKMIIRNRRDEFQQLAAYLKSLEGACEIALEPTADYHRCLAYFLGSTASRCVLFPASLLPEHEKRCTTHGTRMIRKTRKSFCTCFVTAPPNVSTIRLSNRPTIFKNSRRRIIKCRFARRACSIV